MGYIYIYILCQNLGYHFHVMAFFMPTTVFKIRKRHLKALQKCYRTFEFNFESFSNSNPKDAKKHDFWVFFTYFFSIFQYEKIIQCNFYWHHQKARPKFFKNHYEFFSLESFFHINNG